MKDKLKNKVLVDTETGEIWDNPTEVVNSVEAEKHSRKRIEAWKNINNTPENLSTEEIEENIKILGIKPSYIKQYNDFQNYYTGNKDKLISALELLSDQAYKCFSILVAKYTSNKNTIQYLGNHVNIVKDAIFAKELGISENKWRRVKKELIENKCIRRIKFNNEVLYKINPTIIGHSMRVTKCTYYAFRNQLAEDFDKVKTAYWDKQLLEEFGAKVLEEAKLES